VLDVSRTLPNEPLALLRRRRALGRQTLATRLETRCRRPRCPGDGGPHQRQEASTRPGFDLLAGRVVVCAAWAGRIVGNVASCAAVGLGGFPAPPCSGPGGCACSRGHPQQRERLPALPPRPLGVALGKPPARDQTVLLGLERRTELCGQTLDATSCLCASDRLLTNTRPNHRWSRDQVRLPLHPWLHDRSHPGRARRAERGALHDAPTPSLGPLLRSAPSIPASRPRFEPTPDHTQACVGLRPVFAPSAGAIHGLNVEEIPQGTSSTQRHALACRSLHGVCPCMRRHLAWPTTERAPGDLLRSDCP